MNSSFSILDYLRSSDNRRIVHAFENQLREKNIKSVAVTSLRPGEGKTLLSSLLALGAVRFMNKRVLIVNAADVSSKAGNLDTNKFFLENLLKDFSGVTLSIVNVDARRDSAISELKEVYGKALENYDLIIFDTPAVHSDHETILDPIIISKMVGHVVMVFDDPTRASHDFQRLNGLFKDWNISVVGSVHNLRRAG